MSVRAEIEANPNAKDAMSPTRQFLPPPPAEEDNMLSKVLRSFLAKSWPLPKSNGRTKKFASSTREEEGILWTVHCFGGDGSQHHDKLEPPSNALAPSIAEHLSSELYLRCASVAVTIRTVTIFSQSAFSKGMPLSNARLARAPKDIKLNACSSTKNVLKVSFIARLMRALLSPSPSFTTLARIGSAQRRARRHDDSSSLPSFSSKYSIEFANSFNASS